MTMRQYLNNINENEIDHNHWFMTKQTMTNLYVPFYIAKIIEIFPEEHFQNENFASYYRRKFTEALDDNPDFYSQTTSDNTYRNAIISEYLGLTNRERGQQYKETTVTDAYLTLSRYIDTSEDIAKYRYIFDRQLEKIVFNVVQTADKYNEVCSVTIFPVIFLYKILLKLYEKYNDSTLSHEEFCLFVVRAQRYDEWQNVIDLIDRYRRHDYESDCDADINRILTNHSTLDIRFDSLFGLLSNIYYESDVCYRIADDQESFDYIRQTVQLYENSNIFGEEDKDFLKAFMQSSNYFSGTIDNVIINNPVTEEQFLQMIAEEDDFLSELRALAERYGEDGTTFVTNEVRLSSVQKVYRDKLIEMQGCKCALCDVQNEEMLIASHIKPASLCNIYEKANINNGLLLCANHDKLFDKFLITFSFSTGKIKISRSITEREKEIFLIDEDTVLPECFMTEERREYLMWHNTEFERREEYR